MRFDNDWDLLARHSGYTDEREMLEDLYEEEGHSIAEIASRLGAGTATINRRLDLLGIKKRGRGGANRAREQSLKLFRLDARVALTLRLEVLSKLSGVSKPLCYKFRKIRLGGTSEFLYPGPSSGAPTLQHAIEPPLGTSTGQEPAVQGLLPTPGPNGGPSDPG